MDTRQMQHLKAKCSWRLWTFSGLLITNNLLLYVGSINNLCGELRYTSWIIQSHITQHTTTSTTTH